MKKVILNDVILGLNGETVTENSQPVMGTNGQMQMQQIPNKFGKAVLAGLLRVQTASDAETEAKFNLANQINDNLKLTVPTVIELSDEDFAFVKSVMDRQPLLIKARFLDMVEAQNAV